MVDLQLRVDDAGLQSAIAGLGQSISDWSGAWPAVAEAVHGIMREQFESEGARGPLGGWTPLSKAYAERKTKEYPGKPLMRATGRLYDSLVGDSPDAVVETTARTLVLGTMVPYAAFSRSSASGERGGGNQPQRALYDLTEADALTVGTPLHSAAQAAAKRLGFGSTADSK